MWHGLWPEEAIYIPWWIWIISWAVASVWANRTVKRPGIGREFPYRVLTLIGFVLLLVIVGQDAGRFREGLVVHNVWVQHLWALPPTTGWAMVALIFVGFAFAWWARIYLGRLWSGSITRKEDHRVVDRGPYAIVRHPIYTGLLLAAFATAAEKGTPVAVIGAVLMAAGYWLKARIEENFLREELGPAAYDAYRRRVPMLVPFGPKAA